MMAIEQRPRRCPRCDSPDPARHPAMQWEGEVQVCEDPWHGPVPPDPHSASPGTASTEERIAKAEALLIGLQCAAERDESRPLTPHECEELLAALSPRPSLPMTASTELVDGYDVKFWRESYRIVTEAILQHLGQFVFDDDEAEEAIFVEAVERASAALSPRPSSAAALEAHRCAVCGWELAETPRRGCVRGNCSLRPLPERYYDPERARREYAPWLDNDPRAASSASPPPKESDDGSIASLERTTHRDSTSAASHRPLSPTPESGSRPRDGRQGVDDVGRDSEPSAGSDRQRLAQETVEVAASPPQERGDR